MTRDNTAIFATLFLTLLGCAYLEPEMPAGKLEFLPPTSIKGLHPLPGQSGAAVISFDRSARYCQLNPDRVPGTAAMVARAAEQTRRANDLRDDFHVTLLVAPPSASKEPVAPQMPLVVRLARTPDPRQGR